MKRWVSVAIGLIAIGIGGAALFGFKFNKPLPAYQQQWTFGSNELKNLNIVLDSKAATVDFVRSTDGSNSIKVEGKAEEAVIDRLKKTKIEDGNLKLDLDSKDTWFSFSLDFSSDRQQITVALNDQAAQALDSVSIGSDSGSVTANGIAARSASIRSDSGSLRVNGITGEQLQLKSDSGSIHASDIRGALQASSDSGSISVDHLTGPAAISSDSGSIKLTKDDPTGADIKSDSGSVKVQLPGAFDGTFDLRSDSGSIHAPDSQGKSGEIVKVRTDSGSIRITETN